MARKSSKSKSTGLGMGLDALIKAKTRPVEEREEEVVVDKVEKPAKKSTKKTTKQPKTSKTKSSKKPRTKTTKKVDSEVKRSTDKKSTEDSERVETVLSAVKSNPRITLWSARSAAVLRYLKKTQPEFSISSEASKLIEDAVKEKYPEIWALFEDI